MLWVRKGLKQRLVNKEKEEETQLMTVDVQGWRIHVGYEPPRSAGMSVGSAIAMMTVTLGKARGPTLAVGNWNQVPDEERSTAWECKQGLEVVETSEEDETTRWDGNRRVDYVLADINILGSELTSYDERKISGHKIIKLEIPIGHVHKAEPERRSKKGAQWMNPGGFTNKEWRALLQKVWGEKTTDKWWSGSLPDIEENWRKFILLLDDFYRTAYAEAKEAGKEDQWPGSHRRGKRTSSYGYSEDRQRHGEDMDKRNEMGDPNHWT